LHHEKPQSRDKVKEFRQQFQTMQYCLPIEKAAPLAARVLESTFANSSDVDY